MIVIAWQGGEPTMMGLDFFRRTVQAAESRRKLNQRIHHTIQTNGVLPDDDWAAFLKEHDFLVRVSIDGPREIHDIANLGWGPASGDKRPLSTTSGDRVTDRSVGAAQFGRFLVDVFDEWVQNDVGRVNVQFLDVALQSWIGEPQSLHIFSETCGLAVALEHNGDPHCCDHFVGPDYLLGNITETPMIDLVASPEQRSFGLARRNTLPPFCLDCDVRFACNGGCPRNRFTETPDGDPGLNYLCPGCRAFFRHIDRLMQFMARMLRAGARPGRDHAGAGATRPIRRCRAQRSVPLWQRVEVHEVPRRSGVNHTANRASSSAVCVPRTPRR